MEQDKIICEVCGSLVCRSKYERHLKYGHKEKAENKCNICGKEFTSKFLHKQQNVILGIPHSFFNIFPFNRFVQPPVPLSSPQKRSRFSLQRMSSSLQHRVRSRSTPESSRENSSAIFLHCRWLWIGFRHSQQIQHAHENSSRANRERTQGMFDLQKNLQVYNESQQNCSPEGAKLRMHRVQHELRQKVRT